MFIDHTVNESASGQGERSLGQVVNLRRIVNPPADNMHTPGGRIVNPPDPEGAPDNLPHTAPVMH
jgi:hypothetical protein